jgi:lipopolysaccharide transport system permease protein
MSSEAPPWWLGGLPLRALWQYRGFVGGMVARELRTRYMRSLLGGAWAVLNPLAMILIYTVVFAQVMQARLPGVDDSLAYSLYLCAGVLPWTYFTELLTRGVGSFLEFGPLLKKVSFPRISLPAIVLLASTVNFCIVFGLFLLVLIVTGRFPGWVIVAFVPLLALQQAFALGLGFLLGALNVFYRDVAHGVGVALQFWFWFTPIVYSIDVLPDAARAVFRLNPMTALVGAYQGIVLRGAWPEWSHFRLHALGAAIVLLLAVAVVQALSSELTDEL